MKASTCARLVLARSHASRTTAGSFSNANAAMRSRSSFG
jgi:hypothetical protein